jgi:hypothetical protein
LLLIAAITLTPNRFPVFGTTGGCPAGTHAGIRAQPGLVQPQDDCLLFAGLRLDRRVLYGQPSGHRLAILLAGPADRLLRRQSPRAQVLADRDQRQADPEPVPNQSRTSGRVRTRPGRATYRGTCPPLPAAPGSPASCSVPSARRDADLACRLSALWNRYGVPCSPTTRPPVESLLIEPTKDPRHLGEGWFRRAVGCATFRTRRTGTGRYARRWPGRTTSSTRVVAHGSHAVGRSRCAAVECRIVRGRGALEPAADRPFALRSRNAWRSWDSARQLRSGISWPECEAVDPSPDDVAPPNTLRNAVRSGMLNQ